MVGLGVIIHNGSGVGEIAGVNVAEGDRIRVVVAVGVFGVTVVGKVVSEASGESEGV